MPALLVQIADDASDEAIDHIYRVITKLALVAGAMPLHVDSDALRSEIANFQKNLSPDERTRLGIDS
jgi:hypothetical protein